jgi:hypothetical protein
MDQLLEGVAIPGGTKKRQILRASAARDPLSTSGEWTMVRPRSQKLIIFQGSVLLYAGGILPPPQIPQIADLQRFMVPPVPTVPTAAPVLEEDPAAGSSGPFVGVSSRSKNPAVLYYYGIDRHNQWIFTPLFRR